MHRQTIRMLAHLVAKVHDCVSDFVFVVALQLPVVALRHHACTQGRYSRYDVGLT